MALQSHRALGVFTLIALGWLLGGCGGTAPLSEAVEGHRPLEGRLVGGFPHAPCERATTPFGSRSMCPEMSHDMRLEILAIPSTAVVDPQPTVRGAGLLSRPDAALTLRLILTAESTEELDGPIEVLRSRVTIEPTVAGTRSDLAAALLRREALGGSPRDLLEAAESASEAVRLDPKLAEAHFNHAVALERLFLRSAASEAWQAFLDVERDGPWADEARDRLELLEQPLPTAPPRILSVSPADDPLGAANEMLSLLEGTAKSGGLEQAVRELERWSAKLQAAEEGELADGYRAMAAAIGASSCLERRPALNRAADRFPDGALRVLAAYRQLRCDYIEYDYPALDRNSAELLDAMPGSGFERIRGRVHWLLATAALDRSDPIGAEVLYRTALASLESAGDEEASATVQGLLAMVRAQIGDVEGAWRLRYAALSRAVMLPGHGHLSTLFIDFGRASKRLESPHLALAFQSEASTLDLATGRPLDAVYARLERAERLRDVGAMDRAAEDLDAAQAAVDRIADPATRAHEQARVDLATADITDDPDAALRHLAAAESTFSNNGVSHWTLAIAQHRARALDQLGRRSEGLEVLAAALQELEVVRGDTEKLSDQVRLFDRATEIVETMIDWTWQTTRDTPTTWSLHERSIARWLRQRLGVLEFSVAGVVAALPPDGILVESKLVGDRLMLWRLAADGIATVEVDVDRRRLFRDSSDLRQAIASGDQSTFLRTAEALYDRLLAPLDLPTGSPLVIVPEPALRAVPFAALLDRRTGRFLVEDHTLVTAPSAAVYARAVDRGRTARAQPRTVLAVGDPLLDPARGLDPLVHGREEARMVAARYAGSEVLTGADATAAAVFGAIDRHPWAHFATHALPRSDQPMAATLLLAPGGSHTGDVTARDLYGQSFPDLELVVLVACGSGLGYLSPLEGPLDLAHPLLAAGVPRVITTLWSIDDATSRDLIHHFYDAVDVGGSPAHALREAQRALLGSSDPALRAPKTWAAFQLIGTLE